MRRHTFEIFSPGRSIGPGDESGRDDSRLNDSNLEFWPVLLMGAVHLDQVRVWKNVIEDGTVPEFRICVCEAMQWVRILRHIYIYIYIIIYIYCI